MTAEQWPLDTYTLPPVSPPGAASLRVPQAGRNRGNPGGVYPYVFGRQGV